MKQFGKILEFELLGYLKNKVFVGITLFLVVAIAITMFIPSMISFSDEDESTLPPSELPVMLVYSDDAELLKLAFTSFSEMFTDYNVVLAEDDVDTIKGKIAEGEVECAFVMENASTFTYYVNNLSMYDANTAMASELMREIYRLSAMINSGVSAEDAIDIMSVEVVGKTETLGKDQMQNFFYTYIMIFALYMVIMLYGQMVATSVATEKSSRAMEVLITSAKPTSMMFGKVLAACLAGFMQLVLIFGSAVLFYNINKDAWGDNIIIDSIFNIPVELLIYMLVFFVLGFLIYAFLYGAIGSTASKLEDINTSVMPITFLFIIAFMVVMFSMSSGDIDNTAMLVCSYIPFTSPMAMFTRIAMSTVMWYEIFISIAILALSVVGVGFLSAKIYRIGVVLYGTPPKLSAIIKMLRKVNKN